MNDLRHSVIAIHRNQNVLGDAFRVDLCLQICFSIGAGPFAFITIDDFNLYDEYGITTDEEYEYVLTTLKVLSKNGLLSYRPVGEDGFYVSFDKSLLPIQEKEKRRGFVYLVSMRDSDLVKIGVASNVSQRIKQLQTANPHPLDLIASVEAGDCFLLESKLHEMFRGKRQQGEWFALNNSDLFSVTSVMTLWRDE